MPEFETWSEIGFAVLLAPAAIYALAFYAMIGRDLAASARNGALEVRNFILNATGPVLGIMLYLLVVGGPFLILVTVIDRVTDA